MERHPLQRIARAGVVATCALLSAGCAEMDLGALGTQTAFAPAATQPGATTATGAPLVSAYPPYTGIRKRLAVLRLENKVKMPVPDQSWRIGEGLTEMLATELFRTGRYVMVERAALTDIVKEQELGQTGLVRAETAARVGDLLGAQILVAGAVTEFEGTSGGGGGGVGYRGFRVQLRTRSAHVAVDIRLVDAATGQILKSHSAAGRAQETALAFAGVVEGVEFGSDAFMKTPLGQATREAIARAVGFITQEMEAVPWTARVVDVKGDQVFINAGANMNLQPGTRIAAYSKGEELTDPTTGLSLGSQDTRVGELVVTRVEEKFSIGTYAGDAPVKRGDVLRVEQPPPPPPQLVEQAPPVPAPLPAGQPPPADLRQEDETPQGGQPRRIGLP
jgi:curli biogenesis system outer membrane secretion channel CsgG